MHGHPFRKLLRDSELYASSYLHYLRPHCSNIVSNFYRDIYVEITRLKRFSRPRNSLAVVGHSPLWDMRSLDKCVYHRHSDMVERCEPLVVYENTPYSDEENSNPGLDW